MDLLTCSKILHTQNCQMKETKEAGGVCELDYDLKWKTKKTAVIRTLSAKRPVLL